MASGDFKLDAQLREVTVPSGLLERLLMLPFADDDGLDEAVRDVELPEGFLQRLSAIPLGDDEGLDEALRDVPVPYELQTSFRRHAHRAGLHRSDRPMDRAMRISRIAMALSLIVAVTLSLGSAFLMSWLLNQTGATGPRSSVAKKQDSPPQKDLPLETSWGSLAEDNTGAGLGTNVNAKPPTAAAQQYPDGATSARREISLAPLESSADRTAKEALALGKMPDGAHLLASPAQGELPGIHNNWDDLPELPWRPTSLAPHGLDWPLVPEANRSHIIRYGIHPFVVPQAGSVLQSCAVPLVVEPASYELTRRYLERNEMPPPSSVRTEDFLAAMDYDFPKPAHRGLGLTVAGGPSPISDDTYSLLQLGVRAWQGEATKHAPLHLVFLVDTSTSMRWGSRMEIVRRALAGLPEILGPGDRVSLSTFNQAAHVLVEDLGHDAMSQFRAAVSSLAAEGSTNFTGGLRESYSVARESIGPNRPQMRIVLLTDGLLDLDPATAEKIQQQVADAAREKIRLDVIDLGQQQKDPDPQLAAMSKAGQGSIHRATSAEQIRGALREIVTGRPQLVARSARLHVTFNPKAVLEYRIIGHESGEWAGMLPGAVEADFQEGQAATGLFELRLAPNAPPEVARVELTWYVPEGERALLGGAMQKTVAIVHRQQFAPVMVSSFPWLQQASVAAYTAEVLRHSPFIFVRHPDVKLPRALHHAYELASDVDSRVAQKPSYQEFVELIRQEMKAHAPRRAVKD
jgi:Ca-activated chloride channel family protein